MPHEESLYPADWLCYDSSLERFRPVCQKITGFYFVERYPFFAQAALTKDDVRDSLGQVQGLIERIRAEVAGQQGK